MLDLLSAAPKEIRCGEKTLRVGSLKLKELAILQRWIREHSVRPTVAIKEVVDLYAPEDRRQALKDAIIADREWPPAIGTPAGNEVLFGDAEGQRLFVEVMLRKYQPHMTDHEIEDVWSRISNVNMGALILIAFGEEDVDPEKARAAARKRIGLPDEAESTSADSSAISSGSPPT